MLDESDNLDDDTFDVSDFFAERDRREELLFNELKDLPIVEVVGIVSPHGPGGSMSPDRPWVMRLTLVAWRIGDQKLQSQPLEIRRTVTREELDALMAAIDPETVVRVKARVALNTSLFDGPQALLESYVGLETGDTELNARLEQLQTPITYDDELFGTLTFDRRHDWFTAVVVWDGTEVGLSLGVDEPSDLQDALNVAHTMWQDQRAMHQQVTAFAVQNLLPIKNQFWLDDDEAEIRAEEFTERMTLEDIVLRADGSYTFWFDDGDLFLGHAIEVGGSVNDGPREAGLSG